MRPDQVALIAKRLGVPEQDVIDMNRRLGGDASLNAPIREDGDAGEWQDWLVDTDSISQETRLIADEQADNRRKALGDALSVLNERERRIFEARRLADDPITLEELAEEFGVSRERVRQIGCAPSRRCIGVRRNRLRHESPPPSRSLALQLGLFAALLVKCQAGFELRRLYFAILIRRWRCLRASSMSDALNRSS